MFRIADIVDRNTTETEPELWAEGAVFDCGIGWDRSGWTPIFDLSNHIKVNIAINASGSTDTWMWYYNDGSGYGWYAHSSDWDWESNLDKLPTLAELNNTWIQITGDCELPPNLVPCTNYHFHLSFHNTLNGDDNEYQGDMTTFTIEFYATQIDGTGPT